MTRLDWIVLIVTLLLIVSYGVWKGRRQRRLAAYLLADRQLKWPTIALSIMAEIHSVLNGRDAKPIRERQTALATSA